MFWSTNKKTEIANNNKNYKTTTTKLNYADVKILFERMIEALEHIPTAQDPQRAHAYYKRCKMRYQIAYKEYMMDQNEKETRFFNEQMASTD